MSRILREPLGLGRLDTDVNLAVALRRTLKAVRTFDGVYDPLSYREWEIESQLERPGPRTMLVRHILCDLKQPIPCHVFPLLKGGGNARIYYEIPFEYQVGWTAIVQVLGPVLEKRMPRWSFGNRLFRPRFRHPEGKWVVAPFSYGGDDLYMPFARAYKPFRHHSIRVLNALLRDKIPLAEGTLEIDRDEVGLRAFRRIPHPGRRLSADMAKRRFPLPGTGYDRAHYASLDLKKFFPSVNRERLLSTFATELLGLADLDDWLPLLERWLRFSEVSVLPAEQMDLLRPESLDDCGLPTGLIASGFLANVFLLPVDRRMEALTRTKEFRDVCILRYVDDITILAPRRDTLCRFLAACADVLSEMGLTTNGKKLRPPVLCEIRDKIAEGCDPEARFWRWLGKGGPADELGGECERRDILAKWDAQGSVDSLSRHEFVSTTLERLSRVGMEDPEMLASEKLSAHRLELLDLAQGDHEDGDVRRDTRVAFAIAGLARVPLLAPADEATLAREVREADVVAWKLYVAHRVVRPVIQSLWRATATLRELPEKPRIFRHWLRLWLAASEICVLDPELRDTHATTRDLAVAWLAGEPHVLRITPDVERLRSVLAASLMFRALSEIADELKQGLGVGRKVPPRATRQHCLLPSSEERAKARQEAIRALAAAVLAVARAEIGARVDQILDNGRLRICLLLRAGGSDWDDVLGAACDTHPVAVIVRDFRTRPATLNSSQLAAIADTKESWRPPGQNEGFIERLLDCLLAGKPVSDAMAEPLWDVLVRSLARTCPEWIVRRSGVALSAFWQDEEALWEVLWQSDEAVAEDLAAAMEATDEWKQTAVQFRQQLRALSRVDSDSEEGEISLRALVERRPKVSSDPAVPAFAVYPEVFRVGLASCVLAAWRRDSPLPGPDEVFFRVKDLRSLWHALLTTGRFRAKSTAVRFADGYSNKNDWLESFFESPTDVPADYLVEVRFGLLLCGLARGTFRGLPTSVIAGRRWFLGDIVELLEDQGTVSTSLRSLVVDLVSLYSIEQAYSNVVRDRTLSLKQALFARFGSFSFPRSVEALKKRLSRILRDLLGASSLVNGQRILSIQVETGGPTPNTRDCTFRPAERPNIRVALVQLNWRANDRNSWTIDSKRRLKLHPDLVRERLWPQLQSALSMLDGQDIDVILVPEYCVPRSKLGTVRRFVAKTGIAIIAGVEYRSRPGVVRNEAVYITARNGGGTTRLFVPKRFPAPVEADVLGQMGLRFESGTDLTVIDDARLGRFGVAICYDLYSLTTFQGFAQRVCHLFVPAYNRDIATFEALADAGMRLLFANVVIANNGHYGGSYAISPFDDPHARQVLTLRGNAISTTIVFSLPRTKLDLAQTGKDSPTQVCGPVVCGESHDSCPGRTKRMFKRLPAGWSLDSDRTSNRRN